MFFRVVQIGILACFVSYFTVSASANPQQESERKWVPYLLQGITIAPGISAFILILETKETTCARQENKIKCYRHWEELPVGFQRIDQDEVSYLHDYGDGFQQVRLSRTSFCAIVKKIISEEHSCQGFWKTFSQKKIRENI